MKTIKGFLAVLAMVVMVALGGPALASSGTTFRVEKFYKNQYQKYVQWTVFGVVPLDIDLSDDMIAKSILREAVKFVLTQKEHVSPYPGGEGYIIIHLHQGKQVSSLTFSFMYDGSKKVQLEIFAACRKPKNNEEIIWNKTKDMIANYSLNQYNNYAQQSRMKEKRITEQEERERQRVEAQNREIEARKAEEERERQEALKRQQEFIYKNGVMEWVSIELLSTNPFVYEGKTIGIIVDFEEMSSPTQGHFMRNDVGMKGNIIVSDIPKGLFTSKKRVVLAGRVLGKTEVKLPFFGTVSVPHLKFVGVHFCKDGWCRDIIPTEKR